MMNWEHILVVLLLSGLAVIALNLPYWSKRTPKTVCHAIVKGKRVDPSNTPQVYYRGSRFNYVITFMTDEGKEIDVCVIEALYGTYKEGTSGMLTYQGESLLEFVED